MTRNRISANGPLGTEPAGLVRSGMSYGLIDDAIWERLAPLIPARRRRPDTGTVARLFLTARS